MTAHYIDRMYSGIARFPATARLSCLLMRSEDRKSLGINACRWLQSVVEWQSNLERFVGERKLYFYQCCDTDRTHETLQSLLHQLKCYMASGYQWCNSISEIVVTMRISVSMCHLLCILDWSFLYFLDILWLVCLSVCQRDNSWTVRDIITKLSGHQINHHPIV